MRKGPVAARIEFAVISDCVWITGKWEPRQLIDNFPIADQNEAADAADATAWAGEESSGWAGG
jgi:hypothetical protein